MSSGPEQDSTMPRLRIVPWLRYFGALFAFMTVTLAGVDGARGRSTADAFILGGIGGIIYATIHTWIALRARKRRHQGCSTSLTRTQREAAVDAAAGGLVPTDPAVRFEAIRLIRFDLDDPLPIRRPRLAAALFSVAVTGLIAAGWLASPWWWLVAGSVAAMALLLIALVPRVRARQVQRLGELEAASYR